MLPSEVQHCGVDAGRLLWSLWGRPNRLPSTSQPDPRHLSTSARRRSAEHLSCGARAQAPRE
eukprot:9713066-Alexandrium_andersonii.AAC.1